MLGQEVVREKQGKWLEDPFLSNEGEGRSQQPLPLGTNQNRIFLLNCSHWSE